MRKIKNLLEFFYSPKNTMNNQKFNEFSYFEIIIISAMYCLLHYFLYTKSEIVYLKFEFVFIVPLIVFILKNAVRASIVKLFTKTKVSYANIFKTLTIAYTLIGMVIDVFYFIGQYYGLNFINLIFISGAVIVQITYVCFITFYYIRDVLLAPKWFLILYIADVCVVSLCNAII